VLRDIFLIFVTVKLGIFEFDMLFDTEEY